MISKRAKIKAIALVRDKNGNPKIDDPYNIHPSVLNALTQNDINYLYNIHGEKWLLHIQQQ
jgi:hypothetical protein